MGWKKMDGELREREDKEYTRLFFAQQDIIFTQKCAKQLLRKGWHHDRGYQRGSVYFQQSVYTTALVTTYARPFTSGYGLPSITEALKVAYSEADRELHDHFMALRNKMYAHTDAELHDLKLAMDVHSHGDKVYVTGQPEKVPLGLMLTADELTRFLAMTDKIMPGLIFRMRVLIMRAPVIEH
jgi:hypothetical protein